MASFSENFLRHRFLSSLKSAFDQLFGPSSQKRYKNEDRYSKRHSHLSRHVMKGMSMTGSIKYCFVNANIIINSLGTGNLQLVTF
mgnify:FL=1